MRLGIGVELGVGVTVTVIMLVGLAVGEAETLRVGTEVGTSPVRTSSLCSARVRISGSGICSSKI